MKTLIKKFNILLLAAVVCFSILPSFGFAAEMLDSVAAGNCGKEVQWELVQSPDGLTLHITGTGDMQDYIEYEYIDLDTEYPLAPWNSYANEIINVIIDEGITRIGGAAFYKEENLRLVEIPATVTSVGDYAFAGCAGLTDLVLPDSLSSIGYYAFNGCGMNAVRIPAAVSKIEDFAFSSCTNLTDVTISEGVQYIGNAAFNNCRSLTELELPEGLVRIDPLAFNKCTGLTKIVIPASTEMIGGEMGRKIFNFCKQVTVYGYTGSAAEKYAGKYGIPFVSLDGQTPEPVVGEISLFADVAESDYYYKPVNWAVKNHIAGGFDGGTIFGPDRPCTRRQLAIFLWRMADKPKETGTLPFIDVTDSMDSTGYKAMLWAYNNGIIKGYPDGSFRPNASVTRKQTAIMLYRFAGKPETDCSFNFTDVAGNLNSDYIKAVSWGNQNHIVNGSNGKFKPGNLCLRKQIVTFLYRFDRYLK